jgi:hypothetical protein
MLKLWRFLALQYKDFNNYILQKAFMAVAEGSLPSIMSCHQCRCGGSMVTMASVVVGYTSQGYGTTCKHQPELHCSSDMLNCECNERFYRALWRVLLVRQCLRPRLLGSPNRIVCGQPVRSPPLVSKNEHFASLLTQLRACCQLAWPHHACMQPAELHCKHHQSLTTATPERDVVQFLLWQAYIFFIYMT